MITLHRMGHEHHRFELNPDLIATVEACPDTTVHLATGAHLLVVETPEQVTEAVRAWRVEVLSEALSHSNGLDRLRS
jgi:flagellar protein FlbD